MTSTKPVSALPLNKLTPFLLRATQAAAIAASRYIGSGKKDEADQAAVTAMRSSLNQSPFSGVIVIGEGERDQAPMLVIGEKIGTLRHSASSYIDIAVDPLEGTDLTAKGLDGAMAVLAASKSGGLFHAPDLYMQKIAVGIKASRQQISLALSVSENINNLAKLKNVAASELTVTVLDRPRHQVLIDEIKATGAKVRLIADGDIAAALGTATGESDMYLGSGGAPEGVLAASALKIAGGSFCGKLIIRNEAERIRLKSCKISDENRIYFINDLAPGEVVFVATGVTNGPLFRGVVKVEANHLTDSLIMESWAGTFKQQKNKLSKV